MIPRLFGLIGHPLGHTLSPAMQNAALRACRIEGIYIALDIPPDRIRRSLAGLRSAGFSGWNVTVPYKETVLPYLDRIHPAARAVGAVNTIVVDSKSGRWTGHNTDVHGFEMLLRRAKIRVAGRDVLMVGAGGGAKAVCAAVLPRARSLTIFNRPLSQALRLRAGLPRVWRDKVRVVDARAMDRDVRAHVVVNATPVGLHRGDPSLVSERILRDADAAVDLIYNPPRTAMLRLARACGCRTANGLDMLLYQGARAFELWTRRRAPLAVMRRALMRELAHRSG